MALWQLDVSRAGFVCLALWSEEEEEAGWRHKFSSNFTIRFRLAAAAVPRQLEPGSWRGWAGRAVLLLSETLATLFGTARKFAAKVRLDCDARENQVP